MKIVKSAALLLIIILVFSFSVSNMHLVKVSFYTWETPELPLFLMLIFAFALGVAATALWSALRSVRREKPPKKDGQANKEKMEGDRQENEDGGKAFLKRKTPKSSEGTERDSAK